ncbi:MAG: DUF4827 domain-containing protein [Tannerella sp.]|jgi:hypothetical protein|nr:DUF4827 domain-containing protein [Tannerella sp.]
MKKSIYFLLTLFFGLQLIFSCGDDVPTFEELKSAESKIIKRIIAEKGIEVLKEYPSDGIFGDNQFVELESGIYLNVVDSGNGDRAKYNSTTLLVRIAGSIYISADSTESFNTFVNTALPFEFKYGLASYVKDAHVASFDSYYYFFGTGIESVLQYVGDSAVVKMIVPGYAEINNSRASSLHQYSNQYRYYPIYFDKVRYIYYK